MVMHLTLLTLLVLNLLSYMVMLFYLEKVRFTKSGADTKHMV